MANRNMSKTIINVGVDVGKQMLDIGIYEKSLHWQEENNPVGIKRILKRLAYYPVERLVMEATGRYEFNLAQAAYSNRTPQVIRHNHCFAYQVCRHAFTAVPTNITALLK